VTAPAIVALWLAWALLGAPVLALALLVCWPSTLAWFAGRRLVRAGRRLLAWVRR
jgi:hypothetical protein